jgi:hypothetical protein
VQSASASQVSGRLSQAHLLQWPEVLPFENSEPICEHAFKSGTMPSFVFRTYVGLCINNDSAAQVSEIDA